MNFIVGLGKCIRPRYLRISSPIGEFPQIVEQSSKFLRLEAANVAAELCSKERAGHYRRTRQKVYWPRVQTIECNLWP